MSNEIQDLSDMTNKKVEVIPLNTVTFVAPITRPWMVIAVFPLLL